jgi:hypothetical protein
MNSYLSCMELDLFACMEEDLDADEWFISDDQKEKQTETSYTQREDTLM